MLWSLTCVLLSLYLFFRAWVRSRMSWNDFFILRGSFVYGRLLHRWSSNRHHPFPRQGAGLIVCNHSCSADGPFILAASDRPVSIMVASEHFNVHPMAHAILKHLECIPVVRTGQDPRALRQAMKRLTEGNLVCVFPEGNLSGVALSRRRMAKPGMAYLAWKFDVPVYPVYIAGGPCTDRLLNSWIMPTPRAVRLHIGNPLDLSHFRSQPFSRRLIEDLTQYVMSKIEEMNPSPRAAARG